ncbi:MAG: response regulator [Methylophaga sp.]|nr:response regulator [Methylophaga sp.]
MAEDYSTPEYVDVLIQIANLRDAQEAEIIETGVQRYINEQTQGETGVERYISNLTETETETETSISDDDELQQIFLHEAVQHINSFKDAFKSVQPPFSLQKELLRAAHSLKGCANIAQVMPVAAVATQLDQTLRIIYENNVSLNKQDLLLLSEVIDGLDHFISYLKTPLSDEPDILPLLDNLAQITPKNKERKADNEQEKLIDPEFLVVFLEETDDLLSQYSQELAQLQKQPDNTEYQDAIHTTISALTENAQHANRPVLADLYQLLNQLIQQQDFKYKGLITLLDHGYEEINNQIENLIQNKPPANISKFKQQVEELLQRIEEDKLIQEAPTEWFSIPSDDPELLEAFTEECEELLESSHSAISSWQKNRHNADASMQLQRVLHTIKGSARLTDIRPIADLTHHTESLVFLVADQKQDPDDDFFTLLQRSQDRLSEMQEFLARRESIPFAHDLLTEISRFTGQAVPKPAVIQTAISDESSTESAQESTTSTGGEQIRVRADLLDFLTNFTGEVNISRDRVGQQNSAIQQQLVEMESTVSRLQDQLRNLEIETETQILFRYEDEVQDQKSDFDPLEFDRFSMIQQLSRSLTESVSDMNEITHSIDDLVRDSDAILLQQSRLSADLEQGLMNTRLLPFTGLVPRFERIIRQVNSELGKHAELTVHGADRELDRTILDRIVAPLEHIIRNAIAHGIETPEMRADLGKEEAGQLTLSISREGSEILLSLSDDGQGINVEKVRNKALEQGLINPDHMPSDDELIQLILTSGFSTADNISQLAGRGVGMDVVSNEIRSLKGRLSIQSEPGQGTTFNIRLPLTLSIMQSLMVGSHDEQFAIPLASVHAGSRITVEQIQDLLNQEDGKAQYEFNGEYYHFIPLANLLEKPLSLPENPKLQLPVLLFRYGDMHIALLVDEINSNREIVLKSMGEQLSHISSITGATILGDGQVVFILDIPALVNSTDLTISDDNIEELIVPTEELDRTPIAMVVDDSITMRKVSGNLLRRHGFEVITAKDGIDAVAQLNEQEPDIILLDVEMPRMDGFEFATLVRNVEQYSKLPIIMITSRTGDKHRTRAANIGVNAYLGKPYQELELVEKMQELLGSHYPHAKQ